MLVDVHAHLDWEDYSEDLGDVIKRARENGVVSIITNGVNPQSNRMVVALAKKYSIVKPALGLYPVDAVKLSEEDLEKELEFIKKSKPFAIGEIGLDMQELKSLNEQKAIFMRLLEIAEKLKVPAIIHSRKAELEVVETLETMKIKKAVLHTFMGKLKYAKRAEDNGYYFSIPPIVNHSEQMKALVEQASVSHLLTETDSPFLSHERGKRNEPVNVKVVLDNIAKIKGLDRKEAENIIYANYMKLF